MQPPTLEQQWWPWQLIGSTPAHATTEIRVAYWAVQPDGRYLLLCRVCPAEDEDGSAWIEGPFANAGEAVARARAWCQEVTALPGEREDVDLHKEVA